MRVLWLTATIVLVDQATKMIVVQTMYRSQTIPLIGDWLSFTYTENPGMAFGITFGPPSLITWFSIVATAVIFFYLISIRKGYAPYRVGLALVLGGAVGNIIDRVFYGSLIYGEPFFQGRVVDFIHFNLWRGYLPEAIPLLGGKYVALFPIWNVADMSIVVGVVGILFFQKAFHVRQVQSGMAGAESIDGSVDTMLAEQSPERTIAGTRPAAGSSGIGSDKGDPGFVGHGANDKVSEVDPGATSGSEPNTRPGSATRPASPSDPAARA